LGLTLAGLAISVRADAGASESIQKEVTMTARGTFEVKMTPQPPDDSAGGGFDRLFGYKQFHASLTLSAKGTCWRRERRSKVPVPTSLWN